MNELKIHNFNFSIKKWNFVPTGFVKIRIFNHAPFGLWRGRERERVPALSLLNTYYFSLLRMWKIFKAYQEFDVIPWGPQYEHVFRFVNLYSPCLCPLDSSVGYLANGEWILWIRFGSFPFYSQKIYGHKKVWPRGKRNSDVFLRKNTTKNQVIWRWSRRSDFHANSYVHHIYYILT